MRKFCRFFFETWYGAGLCWCGAGVVTLAICFAIGPYRAWNWLVLGVLGLQTLLGLVVLGTVVYSLARRRWLRALGQFLLAAAVAVGFAVALVSVSVAVMLSERNLDDFDRSEHPWYGTKVGEGLPFAVEYRAIHPFLAEFDRRIVFSSGKSVELMTDTGGAGDFAVYVLPDGRHYLVDGLKNASMRSEYIVDAKAERVEEKAGFELWKRKGKRFVGTVSTGGEFIPGGPDPWLAEDNWISSRMSDAIPFSYGCGESGGGKPQTRFSFRSGKSVPVMADWVCGSHSIYRLRDGRFLCAGYEGSDLESLYRIDATNEIVWAYYKGRWARVPDDTVQIEWMGERGNRIALGIVTESGKKTAYGDEPAELVYMDATYVGVIDKKGDMDESRDDAFEMALARTRIAGSLWDDRKEVSGLYAVYSRLFKTRKKALRDYFECAPGWFVDAWCRDGARAIRVYHAGSESIALQFGLEGERPHIHLMTRERSRSPNEVKYAAAIAATEELKSLENAAIHGSEVARDGEKR